MIDVAKKHAELCSKEAQGGNPLAYFYLSFSKDKAEGGFQGCVIVQAYGPATALGRVNMLGINPGGEVIIMPCPLPVFPELMDRLLSKHDMEEAFGELEKVPLNKLKGNCVVCEKCNCEDGTCEHS